MLSTTGRITDARGGSFIVTVLLNDNRTVTVELKPDFELYNTEYELLDSRLSTEENQAAILEKVLYYQADNTTSSNEAVKTLAKPENLPQFIAESIWNVTKKTDEGYPLYESTDIAGCSNGYVKRYLELFCDNDMPILYSDVWLSSAENYNPRDFEAISTEDEIASRDNVLTYLDGAASYKINH